MIFKQTTIAPAGRNKYGNYLSSGNITKSVVSTTYAGNDTTTTIGNNDNNNMEDTDIGFFCMLSQTSVIFDALDLVEGTSATTTAFAYRGYTKAPVYVCDMESVSATTEDGVLTNIQAPENMGLQGIPSGMSVTFQNNGTSAATIVFHADSELADNSGMIRIPVVVYKKTTASPNPDDLLDWYSVREYCEQVWLEFSWTVNRNGASTYIMDLSNERAGVNCDSAGTIYSASTATLTCSATTYYGTEVVDNVVYSISTQPRYNAVGISIDTDGVLHWASNFSFDGPSLPIDVIASLDGSPIATKTMNIDKNYPGADGAPAVTRWIVTSVSHVVYNPNDIQQPLYPTRVTAWVMKQVGDNAPETDGATTIYYGYDTTNPTQPLPATGATSYSYVDNIVFALKNSNNVIYELETVPIIADGVNGGEGPQGPAGPQGQTGQSGDSGESAYWMTLSNDNASVNCDSAGTILQYSVRPSCKVKLYYGSSRLTSTSFRIDYGSASGVTSRKNSDGTFEIFTSASTFNFTGDVLTIGISGYSGTNYNSMVDYKEMNIVKSRAGATGPEGAQGADAISYWLDVNYGEVLYNPNTKSVSPSSISATSYQQVGEQAITPSPYTTIKYSWFSRNNGTFTPESAYTKGTYINVTSANCVNYSRLRFTLYMESVQMETEDVDILMDGTNGTNGENGRAGAAVRGPYDYYTYSASTRCWCDGSTSSTTCVDGTKWIDVINKDGVYYYCNHTYYGRPLGSYSSYWTTGDTFDFVATNLLLANDASINFLTNNELYLRDSNGYITAGAKGGNGVNFWAGDDAPDPAPFMVYNDGTLVATKGTFGCFTIGNDGYNDTLQGAVGPINGYRHNLSLNPEIITFNGSYSAGNSTYIEQVTIAPYRDSDRYEPVGGGGIIDVYIAGNNNESPARTKAITTNGTIEGARFVAKNGYGVTSPVMDSQIIYTTTASSLFQKTTYWYIDGHNTGIPCSMPRALFRKGSGTIWYYGNESLGPIASSTSSANTMFMTGSTSETAQTWTFNGIDLHINPSPYANIQYSTTDNCWVAYYGYVSMRTGVEHSTLGWATPNAIYQDVKGDYPINVSSQSLPGYQSMVNRGTYRDYYCMLGSSSAGGTITLSLGSEGTMSDITIYSSNDWIEAYKSSSVSQIIRINVSSNTSGGSRWGYVELFNKRKFGVRVKIYQTME